ncbi:hypothetical protein [Aureimonas populi]|uniref:Replication protein n=1 Tax=Aureimonas populi TaxID=1701758 RepID=A0ABW5CHT7_9HYPH|nr:hypothetical protein [Aureimonas populi]
MLRVGLAADERGPSVCGCGRPGHAIEEIGVHRRPASADRPTRAFVSGVYRCGSGWLCPTCAPAVATLRQARVQRVVEATTDRGGTFVMGLVTVSHGPTDRLTDLKKLVTESFAAARRGAPWDRLRKRGGIAGVLVAPEVTHGESGWHFHVHFGMPCLADTVAARAAGEALIARFMRAVEKRGGKALRKGQGVEIAASPEAAGEYIAKGTSWELAAGASGHKSRTAGRTPWDIAEAAIANPDDRGSYGLWREFAAVMPGTRSCVVTPGLAAALGLEADEDDEAGGKFDLTDDVALVGTVPAPTWKVILRTGLAGTFLGRIEEAEAIDAPVFASLLATTSAEAEERAQRIADLAEARRVKAERARDAAAAREARARLDLAISRALDRLGDLTRGGADTRDRLARACDDVAAACPDLPRPTPADILSAAQARRPAHLAA